MNDNPTPMLAAPFFQALATWGKLCDDFWYKFVYFPTTTWDRTFNPQFFFGCNTDDVEIEHHVLNKVGSYGSQLGTIIDVLDVIVARLPEQDLTPRERETLQAFHQLSRQVDAAVDGYRGPREKGITRMDISRLIADLAVLEETDPVAYRQCIAQLRGALPRETIPTLETQPTVSAARDRALLDSTAAIAAKTTAPASNGAVLVYSSAQGE